MILNTGPNSEERSGDDLSSRIGPPYYFLLPRALTPHNVLPLKLMRWADEVRWLINVIVRKLVCRDVDAHGYARLHWDVLGRVLTRNKLCDLKRALVQGGIIQIDNYQDGVRATGYRLADELLSDRHKRVPSIDPILLKRIANEQARLEQEQRKRRLPIHDALDHLQHYVTVTDEADTILASLPAHTRLCQGVLIDNIRRRDYRFSVGSTRRCYNSVTGVKRELRKALRMDGEPLGSVDLSCAQPALLAMLMASLTPSAGLNIAETYIHVSSLVLLDRLPSVVACELARFASSVCSGAFWDELSLMVGWPRSRVKQRFLVDVLAKRGHYKSEIEDVFRSSFPSVYGFIQAVNRDNHGLLINLLQRLEAWLVIETVAPHLVEQMPIVPIHDAIFCRVRDVPIVDAAFQETFDRLGFWLATKRETWLDEVASMTASPAS